MRTKNYHMGFRCPPDYRRRIEREVKKRGRGGLTAFILDAIEEKLVRLETQAKEEEQ